MAKYRYRRVELGESVYFQQLTLSQQIVTSKKNEIKIQHSQTHNSFLEAKSFVPLFGTNIGNTATCKQYVKGMRGGGCLCIGKACRRVRSRAIQNASWQKLGLLFCNWSSYYLHLILLTLKEILIIPCGWLLNLFHATRDLKDICIIHFWVLSISGWSIPLCFLTLYTRGKSHL